MPYIGNTTSDFSIDTGNITNRAVTAIKLSPSSVGSNGQVLSVDGSGNLQWSADSNAPEGTAVLSTGESGTTKYLRVDGDGTCSWQLAVDATKIPLTGGTFSGDVSFFGGATNVIIHYDASDNALEFWDGTKAYFGTDSADRLEIYHDSGTNYIKAPDGTLHLRADNFQLVSDDSSGRAIYLNNSGGHLELGFDGNHDAQFTGTGVTFLTDLTIPDKIIHSGDTNTAIRFPSADTFTVETAGTERFRIDSGGRVSIGNNPTVHTSTLFHIEDTGELNVKFEGSTSTLGARLTLQNNDSTANSFCQYAFNDAGGQSTSVIQGINTDNDNNYGELAFLTRNAQGSPPAERVRIDKDGNVGIGTTSPDYNLDIRAASGDTWVSVRGGTNQGYQVRKTDNTLIGYYGSGGGVNLGVNDNAIAAPAGSLRFQTGGTAAANERFLIDSAGNIECKRGGIDAIPPFQIYGSGNASDAVADNLRIHNWGDANGDYWQLGSNLGLDASGNNTKPSTTLKGAAVNIDGRGGRIFLKTSSSNTSTVNEAFIMNEVGHITKPKQPCFCAEKNGSGSTPNTTNATQIFQTENFDIGNNYDNTTGIFTAPVAGKYFFYVQMLTNSTDTRCLLFFNKNNSSNVMEISATSQNYNSIKSSIFISLAANDTMRVNNHSSSSHTKLYADSSYQNQFMGWLVC